MREDSGETLSRATLLAAEPQLFVADVGRSCGFYTEKLGFKVAFTYGEPMFYGQVVRDGASLNLRHVDIARKEAGPSTSVGMTPSVWRGGQEAAMDAELRQRERLLSASITVDDAEALFAEFQAAGVELAQALKAEPWGARTFIVGDPDGNLILFAG